MGNDIDTPHELFGAGNDLPGRHYTSEAGRAFTEIIVNVHPLEFCRVSSMSRRTALLIGEQSRGGRTGVDFEHLGMYGTA